MTVFMSVVYNSTAAAIGRISWDQ